METRPVYSCVRSPVPSNHLGHYSAMDTTPTKLLSKGQSPPEEDDKKGGSERSNRRRGNRRLNFDSTEGGGGSSNPGNRGRVWKTEAGGKAPLSVQTECSTSTREGSPSEEFVEIPSPSRMPLPGASLILGSAAVLQASAAEDKERGGGGGNVATEEKERTGFSSPACGMPPRKLRQGGNGKVGSPPSSEPRGGGNGKAGSPPSLDLRGAGGGGGGSKQYSKRSNTKLLGKTDSGKYEEGSVVVVVGDSGGNGNNGNRGRQGGKRRGVGNGGPKAGTCPLPGPGSGQTTPIPIQHGPASLPGSPGMGPVQSTGSPQRPGPFQTSLSRSYSSPLAKGRQVAFDTDSPTKGGWRSNSFSMKCTESATESVPYKGRQQKGGKKKFPEHWEPSRIAEGLKNGELLKSVFRVNGHNRTEAYCTVEGISVDALIYGIVAQNRAMDGDVVAVKLNSVSNWVRLKGGCKEAKEDASESNNNSWLADDSSNGNGEDVDAEAQVDIGFVGDDFEDADEVDPDAAVERDGIVVNLCDGQENGRVTALDEAAVKQLLLSSSMRARNRGGNPPQVSKAIEAKMQELCLGGVRQRQAEEATVGSPDLFGGLCSSFGNERSQGAGDLEVDCQEPVDLAALLRANPMKRPTATVVGILEKSPRRETIVGYLELPKEKKKEGEEEAHTNNALLLVPADSKFPKMIVYVSGVPDNIKQRLRDEDETLAQTLVAARVNVWRATSYWPTAIVARSLGQAGEIEAETAAIMFEFSIHPVEFPSSALESLPKTPWRIPENELKRRVDLRHRRIFSIDPPTARDLDDALSIEELLDGNFHIGVHIADVSYFVKPGTTLDAEAQRRSTSVYLIQRVLPMLPPLLCEELCSLNPGKDRFAFSITWVMTPSGEVLSQSVGRTIINSCCKLSYPHAQAMIEGQFEPRANVDVPQLHGGHSWEEVVGDVLKLNGVARRLREKRFAQGALRLDGMKLKFFLDDDGNPTEFGSYEQVEANFLVEEFMLLANMTAAATIARAYPKCALLRRHPPPNLRKLNDLEELCKAQGYEFDSSDAGAIHTSLQRIRQNIDDPVIFEYLQFLATKPMQLAKYFCTEELDNREMWGHYALAVPMYTHFTSPIRRYPDIIVHRTLAAVLEVEELLQASRGGGDAGTKRSRNIVSQLGNQLTSTGCFTGLNGEDVLAASSEARNLTAQVAQTHKVPSPSRLREVASWCNERNQASKWAQEASDRIYLCLTLKRKGVLSDARVVSLGPRFMNVFVAKLGQEKRIWYEDIEGVKAEWFATTETLILDLCPEEVKPSRRGAKLGRGGHRKAFSDIATIINPAEIRCSSPDVDYLTRDDKELGTDEVEGAVLPLTLTKFKSVPVALHAVQEKNRPMDVGVRLYISSYMAGATLSDGEVCLTCD